MKLRFWMILFLLIFLSLGCYASYNVDDLWIVEIIVNEDLASSQVTDALIIEEKVYLPLKFIAGILQVPLNIDHDKGIYSFLKPGDLLPVVVNLESKNIKIDDQEATQKQDMWLINGELYMDLDTLGDLLDADLKYIKQHVIVYITTTHLAKKEEKRFIKEGSEQEGEEKEVPPFSISNIKYQWNLEWESNCGKKDTVGTPDDNSNSHRDKGESKEKASTIKTVEDDLKTILQLDLKGTIYDWEYRLIGDLIWGNNNSLDYSLDRYLLTRDMGKANLSVGKMNVSTEQELNLKQSTFDGVSLVSDISPIYRMNGNRIQLNGEAPEGSQVSLFINGWLEDKLYVKQDGNYLFENVLLPYSNMVNEIKIIIKKPGGEVEELFRYISVSDAILNQGELDYLVQMGKLKGEACSGDYLWNSIMYWGVSGNTTLGFSSYGEINDCHSSIDGLFGYNYNSLRLNQRFDDNWLGKLVFYNILSNRQNNKINHDLGYKLNLDYKDSEAQVGFEYHKEAHSYKDEEESPSEDYHLYYIHDVTTNGFLEGQIGYQKNIANPSKEHHHYDLGYNAHGHKWESTVYFSRDIFDGEKGNSQNSVKASLGYLIRPNMKLLQDVRYKAKWNQTFTEEIGTGLEGLIEVKGNTFLLGIDWNKNLTSELSKTDYFLSWSKRFEVTYNQFISTKVGCQYQISDDNYQYIVPMSLQYYYLLPNDAKIKLTYQGQWEKNNHKEEMSHKLGITLEGAFNFFGGKITSTSPHIGGSQIGMVTGTVFRDSNQNGQFDEGEKPLAGIPVRLDRKVQITDEQGNFSFKCIPHGVHYLGFDYSQLPIELTPSVPDQNIKVEANGVVKKDLGLYVIGAVDGEILIPGLKEEYSLQGIKIIATPGDYVVYTDSSGYYYFDQLPPGEYLIEVDISTLPSWILATNAGSQKAQITDAGEYIAGINFNFTLNPDYQKLDKTEKVEVIKVEMSDKETADGKAKLLIETIEGTENRLIELSDQILKVDLRGEKATYNGKTQELIPFFLVGENIWTPIRTIAEVFESKVFWDPELQRVYIVDEDKNILFDVQLGYVMSNGQKNELVNGTRVEDNYTFITLKDLNLFGFSTEQVGDVLFIYKKK